MWLSFHYFTMHDEWFIYAYFFGDIWNIYFSVWFVIEKDRFYHFDVRNIASTFEISHESDRELNAFTFVSSDTPNFAFDFQQKSSAIITEMWVFNEWLYTGDTS